MKHRTERIKDIVEKEIFRLRTNERERERERFNGTKKLNQVRLMAIEFRLNGVTLN